MQYHIMTTQMYLSRCPDSGQISVNITSCYYHQGDSSCCYSVEQGIGTHGPTYSVCKHLEAQLRSCCDVEFFRLAEEGEVMGIVSPEKNTQGV